MKTNYSRPINTGVIAVSAGSITYVTVPDGEVWTILGVNGIYNGPSGSDYAAVIVIIGGTATDVFTFNTGSVGNNSFTLLCNIVLDAGDQIGFGCTTGVENFSGVASGIAETIY